MQIWNPSGWSPSLGLTSWVSSLRCFAPQTTQDFTDGTGTRRRPAHAETGRLPDLERVIPPSRSERVVSNFLVRNLRIRLWRKAFVQLAKQKLFQNLLELVSAWYRFSAAVKTRWPSCTPSHHSLIKAISAFHCAKSSSVFAPSPASSASKVGFVSFLKMKISGAPRAFLDSTAVTNSNSVPERH
jgi:hypothetical protein